MSSPPSLVKDSPGVSGDLQKLFPADFERLDDIYRYAADRGSVAEGAVKRSEGVSFNPRPARVASILVKTSRTIDSLTIGAAFLICCERTVLEDSKGWQEEKILALEALSSPGNSEKASLLSLAHALDTVRHLHMTTYSREERMRVAQEISRTTEGVVQTGLTSQLSNLLATALKRYV